MELIDFPLGNQALHCDHIASGNNQFKNMDVWEIEIGDRSVMESYRVLRFCPICAAVIREASHLLYEDRRTEAIANQIMVNAIKSEVNYPISDVQIDADLQLYKRIKKVVKEAIGI